MARTRPTVTQTGGEGAQPGRLAAGPSARKPRRWRRLAPGAVLALVIVVAGALLLTARSQPSAASSRGAAQVAANLPVGIAVGDRAPDFTLKNLDGKPVRLSSFRGHPVLLHFWAVACTTCQGEQPAYLKAMKTLGSTAPAIVAVDAWGESASYVRPYVEKNHIPGAVLVDPAQKVFYGPYQGQGTPTSFYIDASGVIRKSVIGPQSYSEFLANVRLIGA
jgi:peroxiredoxin